MARKCNLTSRKALTGNKRSHAMNASKRKFELNLQTTTIIDKKGNKVKVAGSAKGIRTLKRKNKENTKEDKSSTPVVN